MNSTTLFPRTAAQSFNLFGSDLQALKDILKGADLRPVAPSGLFADRTVETREIFINGEYEGLVTVYKSAMGYGPVKVCISM